MHFLGRLGWLTISGFLWLWIVLHQTRRTTYRESQCSVVPNPASLGDHPRYISCTTHDAFQASSSPKSRRTVCRSAGGSMTETTRPCPPLSSISWRYTLTAFSAFSQILTFFRCTSNCRGNNSKSWEGTCAAYSSDLAARLIPDWSSR